MNALTTIDRSEAAARLGLPSNLEAEQALLAAVMYENSVLAGLEGVDATSFHEPFHGRVWQAIVNKVERKSLADPVTLAEVLKGDPAFEDMGGLTFLADLYTNAPPPNHAPDYARVVSDTAARRAVIRAAEAIIHSARSTDDGDAYEVISQAEAMLRDLARGSEPGDANLVDARKAADDVLQEFEAEAEHGKPKGLMTGLRCIDRRLRGLRPGHLIIIAGRPSMGKTALARQAAYGCASRNPHHTVAFFCLEMARREITERAFSELSYRAGDGHDLNRRRIAYFDMSGEKLTAGDREHLRDLSWKIPKNMILDDTASLTVSYIRRRVWALKRRGNLGAVFIDYLQIMERPEAKGRNDAAVIGDMTSALKRLARDAGIAIVLLSQINRGVESRDDKRPMLSDLRESGSIEQDANSVLFPYREVYYLERAEPKPGADRTAWENNVEGLRRRMDVICAKNRGGAIGSDHQEYHAEYDAITDVREGSE